MSMPILKMIKQPEEVETICGSIQSHLFKAVEEGRAVVFESYEQQSGFDRQVQGINNATLHLGYCYTWNEPSEVAAICEIVTLNGGTVIHSHGEKV